MGSSCKQSLHTLSLGANGFTFLTTSHLHIYLALIVSCEVNGMSKNFVLFFFLIQ